MSEHINPNEQATFNIPSLHRRSWSGGKLNVRGHFSLGAISDGYNGLFNNYT